MSKALDLLKTEVMRFLASDTPEVMALRGQWGVGKTYAWNTYLKEAKGKPDAIKLQCYAYVSLFGVTKLDELKQQIYQNKIASKDIGIEPSLATLATNTEAVAKTVGRGGFAAALKAFGLKDAAEALQSLSYLSVSEQPICIDDFERKGEALRVVDILGLVSELKERRKCKIVLIMNDESLPTSDDREELARYHEKVIDISLMFSPTEEDCAAIALRDRSKGTELLAQSCVSLGVSNIRVIMKIERLVRRIEPLLQAFHEAVLMHAVKTLTLFGWAHLSEKKGLIEFATQMQDREWFLGLKRESLKDPQRQYKDILDSYGFTNIHDMDFTLLDGIYTGFFDDEKLVRDAVRLHDEHSDYINKQAIEAPFRLYHDSFCDDEQIVVSAMRDVLMKHVNSMTPSNIIGMVIILRRLGREPEAKEALRYFMENSNREQSFYDLSSGLHQTSHDTDIQTAFKTKYVSFVDNRTPKEVLRRLALEPANQRDMAILSKFTAEDFYKLFKEAREESLRTLVRTSLDFRRFSSRDDNFSAITNRAVEALQRIARESALNRIRVENFGIRIPDDENPPHQGRQPTRGET